MTGPEIYLLFAAFTITSGAGLVHLREVVRGDLVGAADRTERERAIAELVALAILADGELSDEERAAIEHASAKASAQEKAALAGRRRELSELGPTPEALVAIFRDVLQIAAAG